MGVPAGTIPTQSGSISSKGNLTGVLYPSVSTTPGRILNTEFAWDGGMNRVEYPGGVVIPNGLFHLGVGGRPEVS